MIQSEMEVPKLSVPKIGSKNPASAESVPIGTDSIPINTRADFTPTEIMPTWPDPSRSDITLNLLQPSRKDFVCAENYWK